MNYFRKALMGIFTASINAAKATWRNVIQINGAGAQYAPSTEAHSG